MSKCTNDKQNSEGALQNAIHSMENEHFLYM